MNIGYSCGVLGGYRRQPGTPQMQVSGLILDIGQFKSAHSLSTSSSG